MIQLSSPRTDAAGLDELAPLWRELHSHHRAVSSYRHLVHDLDLSWSRRRELYAGLLDRGAVYITAADEEGQTVGYAMVTFDAGPDDTFELTGGIAELVTLVVSERRRSAGIGAELLRAAEAVARERGFDTIRIAVMAGNARAQSFYEAAGYVAGEHLLYRRLEG